jgi:uncharacterized protein YcgI (DUF1989 family)
MGRVLSEVEVDVHNALNVFIWTLFLKDTDQYFVKASPVSPGDYLELLAGVNRLGGSQSALDVIVAACILVIPPFVIHCEWEAADR